MLANALLLLYVYFNIANRITKTARRVKVNRMNTQVTINISERVALQAQQRAKRMKKKLEDVLAGWLEEAALEAPVDQLPDDEVIALTKLTLSNEQQTKLSTLLARNKEDELNKNERHELDKLMHEYECGLLRKSQALRVAVERGLREPLQP